VFVYVGNPKLYKYALLTGHGKHPEIRFLWASVIAMFYKKKRIWRHPLNWGTMDGI